LDHEVCGDWKWEYEVLTFGCCYRVERGVESCKDIVFSSAIPLL
jgi:hypothetical protein